MTSLLKINNYQFNFVCKITPELDVNGNPKKFFPQERYDNKKNLKLNKYVFFILKSKSTF